MSDLQRLKVLVLYGGEKATLPRSELLAWLRGPHVGADARLVADDIPHSEGAIDDRVDQAIEWADCAIAIITRDPRGESGAANVIDEIGRWRGRRDFSAGPGVTHLRRLLGHSVDGRNAESEGLISAGS